MSPVFEQLLDQQTNIPPDLIRRIDEVWNEAIDEVAFLLTKQNYSGSDNDYRKFEYILLILKIINTMKCS